MTFARPQGELTGLPDRCAGLGVRMTTTFVVMQCGYTPLEAVWFAIAWIPKVMRLGRRLPMGQLHFVALLVFALTGTSAAGLVAHLP